QRAHHSGCPQLPRLPGHTSAGPDLTTSAARQPRSPARSCRRARAFAAGGSSRSCWPLIGFASALRADGYKTAAAIAMAMATHVLASVEGNADRRLPRVRFVTPRPAKNEPETDVASPIVRCLDAGVVLNRLPPTYALPSAVRLGQRGHPRGDAIAVEGRHRGLGGEAVIGKLPPQVEHRVIPRPAGGAK